MKSDYEDIPNSVITHIIDEYVHSERDRRIMKSYLCDGKSMLEIGNTEDISFKTVQRVVAKHEPKIFRHLS